MRDYMNQNECEIKNILSEQINVTATLLYIIQALYFLRLDKETIQSNEQDERAASWIWKCFQMQTIPLFKAFTTFPKAKSEELILELSVKRAPTFPSKSNNRIINEIYSLLVNVWDSEEVIEIDI